ncbi:MAG: GNAT family N-acetyltransferase [Candidatus Sericytochromatia bacterium]|nr:GNAT family N-acetyltransferase [Candidatus Sericytochromatia bacterium]
MSDLFHIPYRIQSERLVIRCYSPADAPLLKQSVDQSLEQLKIWMPWALHEPTDLAAKVQRLRLMRSQFDLDQDYTMGAFDLTESVLIGGTGLHKRAEVGSLEIGYWVHSAYQNQGYATEITQALAQVAFEFHHVKRIEIRCDPDNLASAAVPRKLGFEHEATLKQRDTTPTGQIRDTMIWTLFQTNYLQSPWQKLDLKVWDVCGNPLPRPVMPGPN